MPKIDFNHIHMVELFAGIRAPYLALLRVLKRNFKINSVVSSEYVEFDKRVVDIANAMYETDYIPQSVIDFHPDPQFLNHKGFTGLTMLFGGFPCQDVSAAGKNAGLKRGSGTRSSLLFEQERILTEQMPHLYFLENVKNLLSKTHINEFKEHLEVLTTLGYTYQYQVLNAKEHGLPQNRERVFLVAIRNDVNDQFVNYDIANTPKRAMKPLKEYLKTPTYNDYHYQDRTKYLSEIKDTSAVDPWYFVKYRQEWLLKRMQGIGITTPDKKQAGKIKLIDIEETLGGGQTANTIITEQWKGNNSGVVPVPIKEYKNFVIMPRQSDGKLENGHYNRVWKTENDERVVGTIASSDPNKIMVDTIALPPNDPLFRGREVIKPMGGGHNSEHHHREPRPLHPPSKCQ